MIGLRAIGKLNTWAWVAGLSMLAMGCKKPVPQPPKEEPFVFENPGGMWMPSQLAEHKSTLEKLGVAIPVEQLADPTAFPLGAVVSLGGCSASFVSPDGLVVTNHHCVIRYLQNNSTPEKNLLEDGYLAATRADELPGGRGARIYVSNAFTDVTDQILGGLGEIADNQARATELEKRVRTTEETCEAGKTGVGRRGRACEHRLDVGFLPTSGIDTSGIERTSIGPGVDVGLRPVDAGRPSAANLHE